MLEPRVATPNDEGAILAVARATDMFTGDEIAWFAERIAAYFHGDTDGTHWIVADEGGVIGAALFGPEAMAQDVWNLWFIGLLPASRAGGRGGALLRAVEAAVSQRGARMLLVESAGTEQFALTRAFYRKNGFEEEATIREFYAPGQDKIVFRKAF